MVLYGVIIPTYNEIENVEVLCELLREVFTECCLDYKIIFVDDNSPDGTASLIEDLKNKYPIYLIRRMRKAGIGSAYKIAIQSVKTLDFIIIMDSDLSHNPSEIKEFIIKQKLTDCDIVYGTRYNGGTTVNWPLLRRIISRGANNLSQIVLGADISDFTNSYRLYKADALRSILPFIQSTGFSFQMETIFIASQENFKIESVPIIFHERSTGVSKIGSTEIIKFVRQLINLSFRRIVS